MVSRTTSRFGVHPKDSGFHILVLWLRFIIVKDSAKEKCTWSEVWRRWGVSLQESFPCCVLRASWWTQHSSAASETEWRVNSRGTQLTPGVWGWSVEWHFRKFPYIWQKNKILDSQKETYPKGLCSTLTRPYNFGTEHQPYQLRWENRSFRLALLTLFWVQVIVPLIIFYTFPVLCSHFKGITFSSLTFASLHIFALV